MLQSRCRPWPECSATIVSSSGGSRNPVRLDAQVLCSKLNFLLVLQQGCQAHLKQGRQHFCFVDAASLQ